MDTTIMTAEMGRQILDSIQELKAANKPFLTVTEAAKYLDVSPDSIRNYINAGELAFSRPGGRRILISRDDINAFVNRSRKPSKAEIDELAATHIVSGAR